MKQINDSQSTGKPKIVLLLIMSGILSFVFAVKVDAVFSVTGPTLICTSGQFTVQNYNNEPLVWSCSNSNLTLTSTQGQNPATFSYNGSGPAKITATITCGGESKGYDIDVWVGVPAIPWAVSSETAMWGYVGNWYGFAVWPSVQNSAQEAVPNLYGGDDVYYYGGNYFRFYFGYEGTYQISATYSNTCGESGPTYLIDGFEVLP